MTRETKGHLALLATNLFFAINLSAVKHFTNNKLAGPFAINLLRLAVCVLLFWIVRISGDKIHVTTKDKIRIAFCALAALGVNVMLFVWGLSLTYSIHASLLLLTTPILITILAAIILKERLSLYNILGLFLGIAGATILVYSGKNGGNGSDVLLGDLLVIGSAISYTIYFILVKPLMQKYPPILVMRWMFTFGLIIIFPFCWNEFKAVDWHTYGWLEYLLMFMIIVPGTFLAYIFNVYGIKVLSASHAGAYIYSQPVFAVIIATIFLREPLEWYKIGSAALIFAGVYFANKKSQ